MSEERPVLILDPQQGWWRPAGRGYTRDLAGAGLFGRAFAEAEARRLCLKRVDVIEPDGDLREHADRLLVEARERVGQLEQQYRSLFGELRA